MNSTSNLIIDTNRFTAAAQKVLATSQDILARRIEAITTMSASLTIFAKDHNETWPFVTVSDFQRRASSVKASSGARSLIMMPSITRQNFEKWGEYSAANAGWIEEGRAYQTAIGIPDILNPVNQTSFVPPFVYSEGPSVPDLTSETMFPIWQYSPISPIDFVNFNLFSTNLFRRVDATQPYGKGTVTLGGLLTAAPGNISSLEPNTGSLSLLLSLEAKQPVDYDGEVSTPILAIERLQLLVRTRI